MSIINKDAYNNYILEKEAIVTREKTLDMVATAMAQNFPRTTQTYPKMLNSLIESLFDQDVLGEYNRLVVVQFSQNEFITHIISLLLSIKVMFINELEAELTNLEKGVRFANIENVTNLKILLERELPNIHPLNRLFRIKISKGIPLLFTNLTGNLKHPAPNFFDYRTTYIDCSAKYFFSYLLAKSLANTEDKSMRASRFLTFCVQLSSIIISEEVLRKDYLEEVPRM